jgi:hypothetical protein
MLLFFTTKDFYLLVMELHRGHIWKMQVLNVGVHLSTPVRFSSVSFSSLIRIWYYANKSKCKRQIQNINLLIVLV